jgi:hypothetical protein
VRRGAYAIVSHGPWPGCKVQEVHAALSMYAGSSGRPRSRRHQVAVVIHLHRPNQRPCHALREAWPEPHAVAVKAQPASIKVDFVAYWLRVAVRSGSGAAACLNLQLHLPGPSVRYQCHVLGAGNPAARACSFASSSSAEYCQWLRQIRVDTKRSCLFSSDSCRR